MKNPLAARLVLGPFVGLAGAALVDGGFRLDTPGTEDIVTAALDGWHLHLDDVTVTTPGV